MNRKDEIDAYLQNLVEFIKKKFCSPYKINGKEVSRNEYSEKSGISKGTLSRLNEGKGYDVPTSTIFKLCTFAGISLNEFFTEFDEAYNKA